MYIRINFGSSCKPVFVLTRETEPACLQRRVSSAMMSSYVILSILDAAGASRTTWIVPGELVRCPHTGLLRMRGTSFSRWVSTQAIASEMCLSHMLIMYSGHWIGLKHVRLHASQTTREAVWACLVSCLPLWALTSKPSDYQALHHFKRCGRGSLHLHVKTILMYQERHQTLFDLALRGMS